MPEIVIRYRTLERIAYWIVILALLTLLIVTYLKTPSCDGGDAATTNSLAAGTGQANVTENVTENATANVSEEATAPMVETCSDGKKNQDESDIDCGGAVCRSCADGKKCVSAADCQSNSCTAGGLCAAAPKLTGEVDVTFKDVQYTGTSNTSAKINGVTLTIFNGKSSTANLELEIYPKTSDDFFYLNQIQKNEAAGYELPYATLTVPPIASGKTLTSTYDVVQPPPLWSASDHYDPGDDFIVEVHVLDNDTGTIVSTVKKTVKV